MILELHNLKKYFATQKGVDDISLSIDQGSIVELLTANVDEKTTMIRMITVIFYPCGVQIVFNCNQL